MSLEDVVRLSEEVPGRYRALILLAGMVGLRWSEAIGLTIGKVHFLTRTIEVSETIAEVDGRLSVEATKTESSVRTLSIPEPLVEELSHHLATFHLGAEPTDLAFTGARGMPLRRSFAARVFKAAVKRAGLDPALTFRGLRKVVTSYMVDDGSIPGSSSTGSATPPPGCRRSCTPRSQTPLTTTRQPVWGERFTSATGTQRA